MWHLIKDASVRFLLSMLLAFSVANIQIVNVQGVPEVIPAATGGWLMYMGDAARTGFADTYIPSPLEVKWERSLSSISLGSVVSDGVYAYITSYSGNVTAVSVETNRTVWECVVGNVVATPLLLDNFLIVGDEEGTISIIERYSGYIYQKLYIGHRCSQHLLCFNQTIFIAGGNWLTAIDVNGTILWTHYFENEISAPPVGYLNNLYILTGNRVWCLKQNRTLWERAFEVGLSSAMAAAGALVLTAEGGLLISVDAFTGETRWEKEMDGEVFSPAYWNGILFTATRNGFLHALSASDGIEIWNFSTTSECFQSPIVNRYSLIFASGTALYCLRQNDGDIVWFQELGVNLVTPFSLASSNIFAGDVHGRIYCISAPKPELKISVSPAQPTLYERGQMRIAFSALAGAMPAVNASVNLTVSAGSLSSYSGSTDSEGFFAVVYTAPIVKAKENFTLSATFSFPGYRNTTKNLTITVVPTPQVELYLNISEERVYSGSSVEIKLTVLREGKPVQGASVYFFCANETIAKGHTDKNGTFTFNCRVPEVEKETTVVIEVKAYGTDTTPFVEKGAAFSIVVLPAHHEEWTETLVYVASAIGCALLILFLLFYLRRMLKR
ncbi:MAG: PQQ-binding-like beta-propeller repeat protein [Thermoplasmata archaeon]